MPTYVVALEPEKELFDKIINIKKRSASLVGDQLYLKDPPHLTLFLGRFKPYFKWKTKIQKISQRVSQQLSPIKIIISGWHVYTSDSVTGNDKEPQGKQQVDGEADVARRDLWGIETDLPLRSVAAGAHRPQQGKRAKYQEESNER